MMERKKPRIVGPGKGLWLIHHMITDDHPWSSMTIFAGIENHRLVERLRKLTLRLSPVFLSIFSRRMSISWWALSSSSWVFSWAIWYLPAAPWYVVIRFVKQIWLEILHLYSLKFFSEFVHFSRVFVSLRIASRQGLLDLVKLLLKNQMFFHLTLNQLNAPEYSHFPIVCFPVLLSVGRSHLAISQPATKFGWERNRFPEWESWKVEKRGKVPLLKKRESSTLQGTRRDIKISRTQRLISSRTMWILMAPCFWVKLGSVHFVPGKSSFCGANKSRRAWGEYELLEVLGGNFCINLAQLEPNLWLFGAEQLKTFYQCLQF